MLPTPNFQIGGDFFERQFEDTSRNNGFPITTWLWDFGDGNTSTLQNPLHTYALPGNYTITLTVTNATGSATASRPLTVVAPSPTASFTYNRASAQLATIFTDTSLTNGESITEWLWDFGDGTKSTNPNPTHVFQRAGTYNVALTVTNIWGNSSTANTQLIVAPEPIKPIPSFEYIVDGTKVYFKNTSKVDSQTIQGFLWEFGDEQLSEQTSPAHTYFSSGIYLVRLIARDSYHGDVSSAQYINVPLLEKRAPKPFFAFSVVNNEAQFTDLSNDGGSTIEEYLWDFGDMSFSDSPNPSHAYKFVGEFEVKLRVKNKFGQTTYTRKIIAGPKPGVEINPLNLIRAKIPADRFNETDADNAVKRWQLHLQTMVEPEGISDADVFDYSKWPPIWNYFIADLAAYELIIQEMNKFMLSGAVASTQTSNAESNSETDIAGTQSLAQLINLSQQLQDAPSGGLKSIKVGQAEAEWYNLSDIVQGVSEANSEFARTAFAFRDGLVGSYREHLCVMAGRLGVILPFCPKRKALVGSFVIARSGTITPSFGYGDWWGFSLFDLFHPAVLEVAANTSISEVPLILERPNRVGTMSVSRSKTPENTRGKALAAAKSFWVTAHTEKIQFYSGLPAQFVLKIAINKVNVLTEILGSYDNTLINRGIVVEGPNLISEDFVMLNIKYDGLTEANVKGFIDAQFRGAQDITRNLRIPIEILPAKVEDTDFNVVPLPAPFELIRGQRSRIPVLISRKGQCFEPIRVEAGAAIGANFTLVENLINETSGYLEIEVNVAQALGITSIPLLLTGCSITKTFDMELSVRDDLTPLPTFGINLPDEFFLTAGQQGVLACTVIRANGCLGPLSLSFPNLPTGLTVSTQIIEEDYDLILFEVSPDVPSGAYQLQLEVTGCGEVKRYSTYAIIASKPDNCLGNEEFDVNLQQSKLAPISLVDTTTALGIQRIISITRNAECKGPLNIRVNENDSILSPSLSFRNLPGKTPGSLIAFSVDYDGTGVAGDYSLEIDVESCSGCLVKRVTLPITITQEVLN